MTQETSECWSVDEETFRHDSLQDLLDSNDELKIGDVVYVGNANTPTPEKLCNAYDIIDVMERRAWDIVNEHADDYPRVSDEARQELEELIKSWIMKHCPPDFYTVTDVREHVLTEEDLEGK